MGLVYPTRLHRGGKPSFYGVPGFISWIDSRSSRNRLPNAAIDLSGNGNHWVKEPTVTGLSTTTATVQYPDVAGNTMVSLPSVAAFDVLTSSAKMLRCTNIMLGLEAWTIVSVQKTVTWDTSNDKFLYRLDAGGLQANGGTGAGYFYNGTTYGTNSAGLGITFDYSQWRVTIQSYTPPNGSATSRHWVMQNGIPSVVGKNIAGMLDNTAGENYAWPQSSNEYLPRSDYTHLALGTVNPLTLSTSSNAPRHVTLIMGLAPRGITLEEGGEITNNILNELYAGAPPFMRVLHCIGDSLHYEAGGTSCINGYYWQDLSAVKKAAVTFVNTAEGGNSIETQTTRSLAGVGRAQRLDLHKEYVANVMIGTNNPTDDENAKWSKVKTLLSTALTTGAPTHLNTGELLACGTNGSTTNPDTSRSGAHNLYNIVMRAGMSPGGDFYTANPTIGCSYLPYSTSIPLAFEVPIAVLDPATAATTFGKTVADTMPSDTANAAQNHYGDFLHPKSQTRPNGTNPIYSRVGMYEALTAKMDSIFWP